MRGTIAVQIFIGVLALFLVQFVVTLLDMRMLGSLFGLLSEVFVLAVIILFQPEIRRLLLALGQNPLIRRFVKMPEHEAIVTEVVEAVALLSRQRIGSLIAFERSTGLRSYSETGTQLQARVTSELLVTIFFSQNPLHDGAVIIRNDLIEAARCILPVSSSMKLSPHLGLRHRAAVGLTEISDAFVIVVSEETGRISFATDGNLETDVSIEELQGYLGSVLLQPVAETHELATAEV